MRVQLDTVYAINEGKSVWKRYKDEGIRVFVWYYNIIWHNGS